MTLSDYEFVNFYQDVLLFIRDEGEDYMFVLASWPHDEHDMDWFAKALAAITRLELSGLITSENDTHEMLDLLANTTNYTEWTSFLFSLTDAGKALLTQLNIANDERGKHQRLPGLYEALSRVFEEHGVGFDAELPYKMHFPS